MRFTLVINSHDQAFCDDGQAETIRLLKDIAKKIERGSDYGVCLDTNGNRAGEWSLTTNIDR